MKKLLLCGIGILCASLSFAAPANVQVDTKTHQAQVTDGSTAIDFRPITLTLGSFTIDDTAGVKTISLGTASGVKFGLTGEKIGFLGATPVIRPGSAVDLRQALINLGLYATGGASPLNLNGGAFTAATGTFTGSETVGGTFGVTGATSLAALSATNAAISGTLGVTGALSGSSATFIGNESVGGALSITGATSGAAFSFTGNGSVGGTFAVTGVSTLAGISGTNETLSGTLGVTGNSTFSGTLAVTGATTGSSLTLSGNEAVGGSLAITGPTSGAAFAFTGNGSVGGTLGVTGAFSGNTGAFSGTLSSGPFTATTGAFSSSLNIASAPVLNTAFARDFSTAADAVAARAKLGITQANVTQYGVVGDGTTDNTVALAAILNAASLAHVQAYIPKGTYKIVAPLDLVLTTDLEIYAEPGAVIIGAPGAGEVIGIDGGVDSPRLIMTGHGTIDNSQRTFDPSTSSGTALALVRLSQFYCDGWTFKASPNFGDSGISAVRVEDFTARSCTFIDQSDVGIYLSGQTTENISLDRDAVIQGCTFKGCGTAAASKRRYRHTNFSENHVNDCGFGFVLWEADTISNPAGRDAIVSNNFFDKCNDLAIEFRSSLFGGVISGNVITDWGWQPLAPGALIVGHRYWIQNFLAGDSFTNVGGTNVTGNIFVASGTTPTTWSHNSSIMELQNYTAGIYLTGSRNVNVFGNVLAMKDWAPSTIHAGVFVRDWSLDEISGLVNYPSQKNYVHGNIFRNLQQGCAVAGGTTLGSDFGRNTFDNVVVPYNVTANDSVSDSGIPWIAYTPTVTSHTGTITSYTVNEARYQQDGKKITCRISITITTNGTGATAIRESLPFVAKDGHNNFAGMEIHNTTKGLSGTLYPDSGTIFITFSNDGTYPGADGNILDGTIVYETP